MWLIITILVVLIIAVSGLVGYNIGWERSADYTFHHLEHHRDAYIQDYINEVRG